MRYVLIRGDNPGPLTGAGTNTYVLPGSVATLIDAASAGLRYLDAVAAALGRRARTGLRQVLVTHAHPDHVAGVTAVVERWPTVSVAKWPWPERDEAYAVAWRGLRDGELIDAGDSRLRVVHTPGHAPDHVCLLEEQSRTVFTGDLVVAGGTVVIPASAGGRLGAYLASLDRIRSLEPRRLLPGHGPEIDEPVALIDRYLAHRAQRDAQILEALATGRATIPRIVERVYRHLAADLVPQARESVLAHLQKLAAEGRVRCIDDRWLLARPSGDVARIERPPNA